MSKSLEEIYLQLDPFEEECSGLLSELKKLRKRGNFTGRNTFFNSSLSGDNTKKETDSSTTPIGSSKNELFTVQREVEKLHYKELLQKSSHREDQLVQLLKLHGIEVPEHMNCDRKGSSASFTESTNSEEEPNRSRNSSLESDQKKKKPNTPPSSPTTPRHSTPQSLKAAIGTVESLFQDWILRLECTTTQLDCINYTKQIKDAKAGLSSFMENIGIKDETYQEWAKKRIHKATVTEQMASSLTGDQIFSKLKEKYLQILEEGLNQLSFIHFLISEHSPKVKTPKAIQEAINFSESVKKIASYNRTPGTLPSSSTAKPLTFQEYTSSAHQSLSQSNLVLKKQLNSYSTDSVKKIAKRTKFLIVELEKFFSSNSWKWIGDPKYQVVPNQQEQTLRNLGLGLLENLEKATTILL